MTNGRAQPRTLAVLGAGNVGRAVGRHWVRAGHAVVFGARRPSGLRPLLNELGSAATAVPLADAAKTGEAVLVSLPYGVLDETVPPLAAALAGKVVIDATNPVGISPGGRIISSLGPDTSAGTRMAQRLPGSRIVRAFTHVMHELLASRGAEQPLRWAMAIAGDDVAAKLLVEQLVRDAGFTPVDLGSLAESGRLDPGGALFPQMFTAADMRARLGELEGAA
jgi:8-hydroxy-5-deazaflavin:NADPH oxidoreductase